MGFLVGLESGHPRRLQGVHSQHLAVPTSHGGWSQRRRESVLAVLTPAKGSRVSSGIDLSGAEPRCSWDCPVFPRERQPLEGSRRLVLRTATPGPCPQRGRRNTTYSLQGQQGCLPSGKGGRQGLGIPAHRCQVHLSESTPQALGEALEPDRLDSGPRARLLS